MTEQWKDVVGYEGIYQVSDLGRVKSLARVVSYPHTGYHSVRERILQPTYNDYYRVKLSKNGVRTTRPIHRLVLLTFVGEPAQGHEACHNDGNSRNNRLANLRWDSRLSNRQDAVIHGTGWGINNTHCTNGHEYTPETTGRQGPHNYRYCRVCKRQRELAWKQKMRETA